MRDIRLVRAASFASAFDRAVIPPMLVTMAAAFDVSLGRMALVASAYYLCYGLAQPVWGMLSDWLGRIRLMQLALFGAAVAGLVSALAHSFALLVVSRAAGGAFFGAVIPTSLVYVGDTIATEHRQRSLAGLTSATSIAIAVATITGGVLAAAGAWRAGFAIPAAFALVLAVLLRLVAEPVRTAAPARPGAQIRALLRHRWALVVIGAALLEGLVALGALPYLAPAVQSTGHSAAIAGLATAVYGAGLFGWTRLVAWGVKRWQPPALLASGGAMFAGGWACAAASQEVPAVAAAALLAGGGFAFLHIGLQAWATEVAPELRATTIAFFASALFVGSSIAAALFGPLAGDDRYGLLFGLCAAACLPLGLAIAAARSRYAVTVYPDAEKGAPA